MEKVEITLADCLACSGCITSAEGVLITQQSQEELLKILNENKLNKLSGNNELVKIIVFTISQQAILSLSYKYELQIEDCVKHLAGYFKNLGADYVLNTKIADDLALIESRNEFCERYKSSSNSNTTTTTTTINEPNSLLPMLTSSCPGWVCYAEKTHGSYILPYISTTRSPQQIMGVLVKQYLAKKCLSNFSGDQIYHVSVMPCYDKKLEASREDFFDEAIQSRDVDCVITSSNNFYIFYNLLLIKNCFRFVCF